MKKYFSMLFAAIIVFGLFIPTSFAQTGTVKKPSSVSGAPAVYTDSVMPNRGPTMLFGQQHSYTVTYRGNGDALVNLKTVFSNTEDATMSAETFTIPSLSSQDITAYQVIHERTCLRYPLYDKPNSTEGISLPSPICDEYQTDNYSYGYGTATYKKASVTINGDQVTVQFPQQIKPNANGSLLLSFRTAQTAKKDIVGAYNFTFETAKISDKINSLQVGINTDSDYYLKDAKGEINYQEAEASSVMPSVAKTTDAVQSPELDTFYQQIGYGTLNKNASSLQPNESYIVNGTYADSQWKLYGKEIAIGIGVVLLLLILAIAAIIFSWRILHRNVVKTTDTKATPNTNVYTVLGMIGFSVGSSFFILLYTLLIYFLSTLMEQVYNSYTYTSSILPILLVIISFSIYSVFLFVPGIFMGIKRGVFIGIGTVCLTIFWLVFYTIIISGIIFFLGHNGSSYPEPITTMDTSIEQSQPPLQE